MDYCGKNIVITGATSGIGLSLLDYFMQRGDCNVCAIGRNKDKLQKLRDKYGKRLFCVKCDVGKKEEVDLMFESLFRKDTEWEGNVDIFIANAGFGYYEKIRSADWMHIDNIFSVNCYSPIYSLFKMQECKKGRGFQFVIIASAVAKIPLPGYALYSATKASIDGFAKAFRYEKNRNIILSIVYPVTIKTPFYDKGINGMKEPLMRQTKRANTENIIKGIYENKRYIYPSAIFRLYLILRNLFPITQIYIFIEKLRFKKWDNKHHNI